MRNSYLYYIITKVVCSALLELTRNCYSLTMINVVNLRVYSEKPTVDYVSFFYSFSKLLLNRAVHTKLGLSQTFSIGEKRSIYIKDQRSKQAYSR